jgi:hypothetical protein
MSDRCPARKKSRRRSVWPAAQTIRGNPAPARLRRVVDVRSFRSIVRECSAAANPECDGPAAQIGNSLNRTGDSPRKYSGQTWTKATPRKRFSDFGSSGKRPTKASCATFETRNHNRSRPFQQPRCCRRHRCSLALPQHQPGARPQGGGDSWAIASKSPPCVPALMRISDRLNGRGFRLSATSRGRDRQQQIRHPASRDPVSPF